MPRPPRARVHEPVLSRRVPARPGRASQALRVIGPKEMLYVSLQLPLVAPAGKPAGGDARRQLDVCLANLTTLLKDAGFTTDHVVHLRAYLCDLADEAALDAAIAKAFVGGTYPALSVVKVAGLPEDALVGVEAVAIKPAEDEAY